MKSLYFVRHGESEFNNANKWTGSTDSPLTVKGRQQAEAAGLKAKELGLKFDVIVSSPLERAFQTAKIMAAIVGYPTDGINLNRKLVERSFGMLEGRKDLVALTKYALDEASIDTYEGVESLKNLQKRADNILIYLKKLPDETILVVGHGAIGRALKRSIDKRPLRHRGTRFKNGELVKLI